MVGEQSAGKSSLLENISGIQFPRAQNTCTRMPCVLTMCLAQSVVVSCQLSVVVVVVVVVDDDDDDDDVDVDFDIDSMMKIINYS